MACNLPTTNISDRVTSFQANYTLNGPFGGSASFVDFTCIDEADCWEICDPLQVTVEASLDIAACDECQITAETLNCYAEDPVWLNGLQRSLSRNQNISTVTISSYFEYLSSKTISTQAFRPGLLSTVFDTVFTYYAGVDPNLVCLNSYRNTYILGPVEGNDLYAELSALATAGRANLFVQVGGCLTVESWKDHTDPVEFVIPESLTVSAEPAGYQRANTVLIRARGSAVPTGNCGERVLSSSGDLPGPQVKEVQSGVPRPTSSLKLNGLTGDKASVEAAIFQASNGVQKEENPIIQSPGEGVVDVNVNKANGQFFGPEIDRFTYILKGTTNNFLSEGIYGRFFGGNYSNGYNSSFRDFSNFIVAFTARRFPVPYSAFGLGAFGSLPFLVGARSDDSSTNSENYSQLEMVAEVPNFSECGVTSEEITNKYVYKREDLFHLAVRRYQEILLAENTWNVEVAYMPCIKLNQMVQFTVPETETCPLKVIKGIVSGINVGHESSEEGGDTTMRLAITDVGCLGQTEITSGNLIQTGCAGSGGVVSPWTVAALSVDQVSQASEDISLFATPGAFAYAYYTHDCATAGDEYYLYFEYEAIQGTPLFSFQLNNNFPVNLVGTGFYELTFNAPADTFDLKWRMNNPPNDAYMLIKNIILRKTVLA